MVADLVIEPQTLRLGKERLLFGDVVKQMGLPFSGVRGIDISRCIFHGQLQFRVVALTFVRSVPTFERARYE